jgi:phage shock protein A
MKYLEDAKGNLGQVKAETAATIAEETAIARKLTETQELAKKYEGYAQAAVNNQNDDDARKFLDYQSQLENKIKDLQNQYDQAKQNSEKMRQMTNKLTEDIKGAQSRLEEMKQKLTLAKSQEKLNEINQKFDDPLANSGSLFDEIQKRVDKAEAAANLNAQLKEDSTGIEALAKKYENSASPNDCTIEARLAQMKANAGQQ